MKSKNFLLSILFNLLVLSFLPGFGTASTRTQSIVASKDAHVYNALPDDNYGSYTDLYCGNWVAVTFPAARKYMTYFYFYLTGISNDWISCDLQLRMHNIPQSFDLDVGRVNEYWIENLIDWNNRPSDITWEIEILNLTIDKTYSFDFSDYVPRSETDVSFLIYDHHTGEDLDILICSREHSIEQYRPQLIFYYNTSNNSIIPGYSFFMIGLISSFSIVIIIRRIRMNE